MGLWAKLCKPVFNWLHMIGTGVIVFILATTFVRVKVYQWAIADRQVLLDASYASPLPRVVIAPRQLPPVPATYRRQYEFGTIDAFSWNVPLWQKIMAPYVGKPGVQYLEVGLFEGRSAMWMFENILTDSASRLTGIDCFDGDLRARFLANLQLSGSADKATIINEYSQTALRRLPLDSYDIIYIDGSHFKDDVLEDALLSWRLLKMGGLLVFDDYLHVVPKGDQIECPKQAIDPFVQCFEGRCEVIHNEWQLVIRKTKP